jgi:hypothetical protein
MRVNFIIEMKSRQHIKNISISDTSHEKAFIEGDLGNQKEVQMVNQEMLEITGSNGVIRLALDISKLMETLNQPRQPQKK